MERRKFLRNALLLGTTATVPGVAFTASQLSTNPPTLTGLVLPPLNPSDMFALLVLAVNREHFELVKSLIRQGIDAHMKNKRGESLLHIAARRNSVEVVQHLIGQGINVNVRDKMENTVWVFTEKGTNYAKIERSPTEVL